MAALIPNIGLVEIMASFLNNLFTTTEVDIRLFQNDYTPVYSSENSDFVEATFDGYAAINSPSTGGASIIFNGHAEANLDPSAEFEAGSSISSEDIYGYYITYFNDPITVVIAAERFDDAPLTFDTEGDKLTLDLLISFNDISIIP